MIWSSGGVALAFLNLATDGDEWSASHPGHFTPRAQVPTDYEAGWAPELVQTRRLRE